MLRAPLSPPHVPGHPTSITDGPPVLKQPPILGRQMFFSQTMTAEQQNQDQPESTTCKTSSRCREGATPALFFFSLLLCAPHKGKKRGQGGRGVPGHLWAPPAPGGGRFWAAGYLQPAIPAAGSVPAPSGSQMRGAKR